MTEGLFDNSIIAVVCLTCEHRNNRTVGWSKRNSDTECDRCDTIFALPMPEQPAAQDEVRATMNNLRTLLRQQVVAPPVPERRRLWRR